MAYYDNMETIKSKTPAKVIIPRGPLLDRLKSETLKTIAGVVGGTLGPHGRPVLIERSEYAMPPFITKDGVTVFQSLGFRDPVMHCFMEATRDAAVRTAEEAGDGTTTATILSEAIDRYLSEFIRENKSYSPQLAVRVIQKLHQEIIGPEVKRISFKADPSAKSGQRLLKAVAKVSGNGDEPLADAVLEAFAIGGDDGHVTIIDTPSNESGYAVSKMDGYPVMIGYEESCQKYGGHWVNRQETQQIVLDKPMFLLYYGHITDVSVLSDISEKIVDAISTKGQTPYLDTWNLVVVASSFSDQALAIMLQNTMMPGMINFMPIKIPGSPFMNGSRQFLEDLAGVTAADIYDPATNPIELATFEGLGNIGQNPETGAWEALGIPHIEMGRYRTNIHGFAHEETLTERASKVRVQVEQAVSILDKNDCQTRLAKLSGGIARIEVKGSSNGEIKERRDRVEDAVCAVRGAIKHGATPAGGWGLARLAHVLKTQCPSEHMALVEKVLVPALLEPIRVLYQNAGYLDATVDAMVQEMVISAQAPKAKEAMTFDALEGKWVNAFKSGLLDSAPALREAVRNSISIASVLGTTGGVVTQERDIDFERKDAKSANEFNRYINHDHNDHRQ